ncbi:hypothetical protein IFT48_01625 [Pseudomonas fluorescens]|uniref:hypothetical protein n=1 Tax=Pseudomonas TaxID=286 RepID=UPI000F036EF9|nr:MULTISPECIES: hypothetical protein [Pseudomonas]MBD8088661.1 hypothetical protein [Pseudomonas fluorescens]
MGNMVAFSISHDRVSSMGGLDFETIGRLHNDNDRDLRVSEHSDLLLPELCTVSDVPGILSSYYHHADGGADLLFTNQWMARLPYRFNLPSAMEAEEKSRRESNQDLYAPHDSKTIVKALRGWVKNAPRKHPVHLQKAASPSPVANSCQSSYSVFGYLTDYFQDISKDSSVVPAILDICLTGRVNSRLFDRYSRIVYLGTFSANTTCLLTMRRNSFNTFALPFRDLSIPADEQAKMAEDLAGHRYNHGDTAIELASMNAIAQSLGYVVGRGLTPERSPEWALK